MLLLNINNVKNVEIEEILYFQLFRNGEKKMSCHLLRKSKTLLSLLLRTIRHILILNQLAVERIGYLLLRKSKNFFILDLKEDIDLG
jgi:hypothetical protein